MYPPNEKNSHFKCIVPNICQKDINMLGGSNLSNKEHFVLLASISRNFEYTRILTQQQQISFSEQILYPYFIYI